MRWSSADARALGALLAGVILIVFLRAGLVQQHAQLATKHDVYALPPPEQTVVFSLGYRAALADLIFAHVLVSAGIHLSEKRLFEFAGSYIDAVNTLDPTFRDPYRYADAILTLQAVSPPPELFHHARRILLRGTEQFPLDQELWASAGQFLIYLGSAQLKDKAEADAWKLEGARLLARACELIGSNENIPYHCITAGALYGDAGKREASKAFLQKMLLVSDDPEIQQMARAKLLSMGEQVREQRVENLRRAELPFVSRAGFAVLGPSFDPAACAGLRQTEVDRQKCATTLRDRLRDQASLE